MSMDEILREQLRNMPHIKPQTDRETLRQRVIAEVERRERHPRKRRKYVLPVAFTGAVALFMFFLMAPWIMQQAGNQTAHMGSEQSEPEMRTMSGDSTAENSPASPESDPISPAEDDRDAEEAAKDDIVSGQTEENKDTQQSDEERETVQDRDSEQGKTHMLDVQYTGSVEREIEIEGTEELVSFDRYIFRPYNLQILIPVRNDGEKFFDDPLIDGEAAVFESKTEMMDDGKILYSSITVSAHPDQSPDEIIEEQIATEAENGKEIGYTPEHTKETLPDGERLIFKRTMQDQNGEDYVYYREVFVTEQEGQTFAFHIGRNELTSEGWGPRLIQVVYPELTIVK